MNDILPIDAIDNSEFFQAFKNGKLKGPTNNAYKHEAWIRFAPKNQSLTTRDAELFIAAMHFGEEFEGIRLRMKEELPRLAAGDAVDFVVAGLNIQAETVFNQSKNQLKKQARSSDIGYLGDDGSIRIQNRAGQKLNPDDALGVLVDGLANILYHVIETERCSSVADRVNALNDAQKLMLFASIEHGLKNLWGRAAWEGCTIQQRSNQLFFLVGDEKFEKLWHAWQRRFVTITQQSNRILVGSAMMLNNKTPPGPVVDQTVVGLENRPGKRKDYIVGKARREGYSQLFDIQAVESSYLGYFLDEVLPNYYHTNLTFRDLWRAWWIFQDIARIHQADMPKRGCHSWNEIGRYALRFSISRTVKAVSSAMKIDASAAECIVDIFTTKIDMESKVSTGDLFQHSAWGRPILRIGTQDNGRILLASLTSPNPIMMMERWMTRTGMIDDPRNRLNKTVRGKVFEREVRKKIQSSGNQNPSLSEFVVGCLSSNGEGSEEIDALIKFGSTIVICELKCLNTPLEPISRYNHLVKIRDAANQANRKTEWVSKNMNIIFDELSIDGSDRTKNWKLVPVVVLNSPYGAGLTVNGCAVTDLDWLSNFLGSSDITVGGLFEREVGASMRTMRIYKDQEELERRFSQISVSPPSLNAELNRIKWEYVPFPTRSGQAISIQIPVSSGVPR